jgi:arylsulfatase A-like enzyme
LNGFARAASGRLTERDWGTTHLKETEMNDTKVADCAVEALKMNHTRPFFIACGLFHPHMPWYVPQKYFDMYPLDSITLPPIKDDDLDDIPPLGQKLISGTYETALQHNQYEKGVQAYLATTTYADTQMGRVLDALEHSPYKDNTIVVLLSDHGFHVGEKKHWQKGTLWEDGTNSLLMFRVPGLTRPNQVYQRPVSLLDIYPTLAELTDLKAPGYVAGRSLVPILKDVTVSHDHPVLTAYQDHISVRTNKYRLIRYADGTTELYDHNKDRNEWINLATSPEYRVINDELAGLLPEFKMLSYARGRNSRKQKSAHKVNR